MEKYTNEVENLLEKLTLEEKITMIHAAGFFRSGGIDRLGIPSIVTSDGACGVRCEFQNSAWNPIGTEDDFVSYLPSPSAVANTWNTQMAALFGKVLGKEARGRGKDMILAPGVNIKRDPRCGRNFEYLSEDPKAVEKLCVPLIKAVQESDVSVCVKHFAVNNQETDRFAVDTYVDERTLREIYLPAFKAAVKEAGALSVMAAYNKFKGRQCCHNAELLDDILRKEWGFDGCIVSDWGGVHDTMEAGNTSLDLEMSCTPYFDNYYMAKPLLDAVKKGEVREANIDDKVRNLLRLMYRLKMLGDTKNRSSGAYNTIEHRKAAYDIALESIVLLKNDKKILPLNKKKLKKLAVIGANGIIRHSFGGGSAEIKALYEITPLMGLKMRLGGNVDIQYAKGYYIEDDAKTGFEVMNAIDDWQPASIENTEENIKKYSYERYDGRLYNPEKNEPLFNEAIEIARDADAVIFFGGLDHNYDVEGDDRKNMQLPYCQDALIERLLEVRPDTVISLTAGSPVEMPWLDKAETVILNSYSGMETGTALADILLGDAYPSGKLSESYPYKYEDTATYKNGEFGRSGHVEYKEGVFYGYRYYEKEGIEVAFPFGHGLGYSDIKYDDIKVTVEDSSSEGKNIQVKVMLTNPPENTYPVKEAVQVYVGENNPKVERPIKELKGFAKEEVKPGESKEIYITIQADELGYYDVDKKCFVTDPGEYTIYAGSSSKDIRGTAVVRL